MKIEVLEKDRCYHIYNRGINSDKIFRNKENMRYFLSLISKYLKGKATVLSYCLLQNHYRLLVRVDVDNKEITQTFSNLFNAYAKAFNNMYGRTGSLFEKHFKRKLIKNKEYLVNTILYIHKNPEHHNIVNNFSEYNFSSYNEIISKNNSIVNVDEVAEIFNDLDNFIFVHRDCLEIDLQGFENLAGSWKNITNQGNSSSKKQQ